MNCLICNRKTEDIIARKLRKGENRNVYHCKSCDLGFLEDFKTDAEAKEYYRETYRSEFKPNIERNSDAEDLFNSYVNFQGERLKLLKPYFSKEKTLLEIGCSAGMFLYHIRDKFKEVVGLDFDYRSAEYASKKCGCAVYTDKLMDAPLQKKYFDIICFSQTLEHVSSPLELLLQIKEYLNTNGILYVEVPNLHDVLLSTYDVLYYKEFYYHSAHLYYFSKKSLGLLLQKAGFSGDFYFIQDYNILNHFYWIHNNRPQTSCMPGLSKPIFAFHEKVGKDIKDKLNSFLNLTDQKYKKMLSRLEITSNISFIGKKNNG